MQLSSIYVVFLPPQESHWELMTEEESEELVVVINNKWIAFINTRPETAALRLTH